jgi:outer membrane protein OmpA-like peptidoglycan-associated protein
MGGYFLYTHQSKDAPLWAIEDIAAKKDLEFSEEEKKALLAETSVHNTEKQQAADADADADKTAVASMDQSAAGKDAMIPSGNAEKPENQATRSTSAPIDPNQKMVLNFEHNSNEIPDEAFESLDRVVRYASSNPKVGIVLEGYTDSYGNYWYNKKLSKFRADIVKNYFAGQGISLDRIKVIGRGSENPIASNDTVEGRKKNRRVEIKINIKP